MALALARRHAVVVPDTGPLYASTLRTRTLSNWIRINRTIRNSPGSTRRDVHATGNPEESGSRRNARPGRRMYAPREHAFGRPRFRPPYTAHASNTRHAPRPSHPARER